MKPGTGWENFMNYSDCTPKSRELQEILQEIGFEFDLDRPNAKNPNLIVKFHGYTLPPTVRFPAMRGILWAMRGIADPGPLSDVAYVTAYQNYKKRVNQ